MGERKGDLRRELAAREAAVREILQHLGVWGLLKGSDVLARLTAVRYPKPQVVPDACLSGRPHTPAILDELRAVLEGGTVKCPAIDLSVGLVQYLTTTRPVCEQLAVLRTASRALADTFERVRGQAARVADPRFIATVALRTVQRFEDVLILHGRIDTGLYWASCEPFQNEAGRPSIRFQVHYTPPETREFAVQWRPHVAYRCGQPFGGQGIDWASWPPEVVGADLRSPRLPVYVQSHALDQLYRREKRALFIEGGEWMVHEYLWQSVR